MAFFAGATHLTPALSPLKGGEGEERHRHDTQGRE